MSSIYENIYNKTIEIVYSEQTKKTNTFIIKDDDLSKSIINFIVMLPNYNMITYLRINYFRQLNSLQKLPDSLQKLDCSNNQLTVLPKLPKSLKILYCYWNQLTVLPKLPKSFQILKCSNNQLSVLPNLPKSLKKIYCGNNKLTILPNLPKSLKILYCHNNQLTSLPEPIGIFNNDYDDEICECEDCDCVNLYHIDNKFIKTQKYNYLIQIIQ